MKKFRVAFLVGETRYFTVVEAAKMFPGKTRRGGVVFYNGTNEVVAIYENLVSAELMNDENTN